jgi:hypothetical protein
LWEIASLASSTVECVSCGSDGEIVTWADWDTIESIDGIIVSAETLIGAEIVSWIVGYLIGSTRNALESISRSLVQTITLSLWSVDAGCSEGVWNLTITTFNAIVAISLLITHDLVSSVASVSLWNTSVT